MLHVIDVELTPNPQALKFVLNDKLLHYESRQFASREEAEKDPLAKGIFAIEGVVSVFYMDKFITIEKARNTDWGKIQRPFVTFISAFSKTDIPAETVPQGIDEKSDELLNKINEILNKKVRPALAFDGGGLEVLGLNGFTLRLKYQGACSSCPGAINGTLSAIESVLKHDVHPAIEVVAD